MGDLSLEKLDQRELLLYLREFFNDRMYRIDKPHVFARYMAARSSTYQKDTETVYVITEAVLCGDIVYFRVNRGESEVGRFYGKLEDFWRTPVMRSVQKILDNQESTPQVRNLVFQPA